MSTSINDTIENFMLFMRLGGVSPKYRSRLSVTYAYFILTIKLIFLTLQGIYICVNKYETFVKLVFNLIFFFGIIQILVKFYTLLSKRKLILKLVHLNKTTLSFETLSDERRREIEFTFKTTYQFIYFYSVLVNTTTVALCIFVYITDKENFLLVIWIPASIKETLKMSPYFEMIYIFQCVFLLIICNVGLVTFDAVFILFIAAIFGQLRTLKFQFTLVNENASVETNTKVLVEIVKKHNECLRYLTNMEKIFSNKQLIILGINMLMTAITIYATVKDDKITLKILYLEITFVVYFQMFVYCIMGQIIENETSSIANAAYNSDWEKISDHNIRLLYLNIITRAQKKSNLTMGGLLALNFELFALASRTTYSVLAFLFNVK